MCLAKAYVSGNGEKELLLAEIASLKFKDGKLLVTTHFGEQREMAANIREIDFMSSSITLERLKNHKTI